MKKKLSNKTFFHNQPYTATAPLEGNQKMRPASLKAELWSAAHTVSTKGKCGAPWPPIENKPKKNTNNQLFKYQRNASKE